MSKRSYCLQANGAKFEDDEESEDYFDDACLNNNNLPYDEKRTDLTMNLTTNGDWTETNNVDLVYDYYGKMNKLKFYGYYTQDNCMWNANKIENYYLKPRLNFDDGG